MGALEKSESEYEEASSRLKLAEAELVREKQDEYLFALSYDYVGDLAETVSLLWDQKKEGDIERGRDKEKVSLRFFAVSTRINPREGGGGCFAGSPPPHPPARCCERVGVSYSFDVALREARTV